MVLVVMTQVVRVALVALAERLMVAHQARVAQTVPPVQQVQQVVQEQFGMLALIQQPAPVVVPEVEGAEIQEKVEVVVL